jgi:hypothetical protein
MNYRPHDEKRMALMERARGDVEVNDNKQNTACVCLCKCLHEL